MTDTTEPDFAALRHQMVEQIALHARMVGEETSRGALDQQVMQAMADVPRHEFVPVEMRSFAYLDSPLPIGYGKTISQPFIVALMTDLLDVSEGDRVLEIGTGLGYQCAVLAELGATVYSVEMIEELGRSAARRLRDCGYTDVTCSVGDGSDGWPQHSPYDRVIVTAAPELIPPSLLHQLRAGGKMVIPAGIEDAQQLIYVEKDPEGRIGTREVLAVRFSTLITADGPE